MTTGSVLDVSTPEKFLAALWDAQYGPVYPANRIADFWQRDLVLANTYLPLILTRRQPHDVNALAAFIAGVTLGKGWSGVGDQRHAPRAWYHLFFDLYAQGLISEAAWGYAARSLYVGSSVGAGDELPGLRAVKPEHLMSARDYGIWCRRPPTVTAYRGTYASEFDATWHGISWTLDPDYAASYGRTRTLERYDAGDRTGWARLVEASIPRRAVLAFVSYGDYHELLVDHELLSASDVREVAPLAADQVSKVRARMITSAMNTRPEREAKGLAGPLDC